MSSRMVDTRASGEGRVLNWTELKCFNCHSSPPSGSADCFSVITNLRVNTGLRLQKGVNLVIRNKGSTKNKRTVHMRFVAKDGTVNCELLSLKSIAYSQ